MGCSVVRRTSLFCAPVLVLLAAVASGFPQTTSNAGSIQGKVTDPTGAVIPGASVEIQNPVSRFSQTVTTDANGQYKIFNVPFNHYHMSATAPGFQAAQRDVDVHSSVAAQVDLALGLAAATQTVNVEATAEDLLEKDPSEHTDVSSIMIERMPVQNTNTGLSTVIQQSAPAVVGDSNGIVHPLGEHAETTVSLDGQDISDQQSKTFSNQVSVSNVQSMEVISGIPPAEFGDKASLIVRATTKSGLGTPHSFGSITGGYGSFGTGTVDVDYGFGSSRFGNFISIDGLNSGRFLDAPEFRVIHDKGNAENLFDRIDYQSSANNSFHVNLSASRSWFQTPNTYDQAAAGQDQREQIRSFNIAPNYTHVFNQYLLVNLDAWVRQDRIGYYPSANPFADQPATLSQGRRLTNTGTKADFSYVKGIHNVKLGLDWQHTFLSENFQTGITDPAFNAVCLDANGVPVANPNTVNPSCTGPGQQPNPAFLPGLLRFDLTRGGKLFSFRGATDIKEEAAYLQDDISLGNFTFRLGVRGDNYNGLSSRSQAEPRVAASYNLTRTNTVLRLGYGRVMVTPYNENLILSSSTGQGGLASNVFGAFGAKPLTPATRNQFDAGFQQAIGKRVSIDGEYFWKYTRGDYDFDTIFNTSLTFPIQWRKSKIDGFGLRVNFPEYRGFSAYSVMGHTRSRFFGPEQGGILFNSPVSASVFRIDHDQAFQQSTHLQYQPTKKWPWIAFTWQYDSGEVAGRAPFASDSNTPVDLTGFSADQQSQIGLFCGNVMATLTAPLTSCAPAQLGAKLVRIPAPGTENDDKNPPRIAPRNLFDIGLGDDNLFRTDRYKTTLRFTVANLTNKVALYNFLSTFSGTHFVSPRTYDVQLGLTF